MIVNQGTLRGLYTGFKTTFQGAFAAVQPSYQRVATTVPSTTRQEEYGWLGQFPKLQEWVGDRVVHSLSTAGYVIRNRDFEGTIGVKRTDIEDDNLGIYTPIVAEFGRSAATFPDELVWGLLKAGFTTPCFDGKPFFATDHPVLDAADAPQPVSNFGGGAGEPWFLIDTTRAIKPVIFQQRKPFNFVAMTNETDEQVFMRGEYRYGTDGRCNVGFSFWQLAYASKQPLTHDSYAAARAAMQSLRADRNGKPLAIRPTLLVVGPMLEQAGRKILISETRPNGETNEWRGSAELHVEPWLA